MARAAVRTLGQPLKNYFINGDMGIWQRNVGTAGPFTEDTSYGYKSVDRWRHRFDDLVASSSVRQWARVNDAPVTTEPTVFAQSAFRHIFRRGNTGVWVSYLGQRIESFMAQELWNSNPTGKVSVGIWVKSDTATSITLTLYNATAQDNFSGETVILQSTKTFTANNTWQQVKWEGITTTVGMVNGVEALFTVTTPAAVGADASDKEIRLSMAQLNKGEVVEQFSLAGRNYAEELTLCQRYYQKSYPVDITPGSTPPGFSTAITWAIHAIGNSNQSQWWATADFVTRMRTVPTATQIYNPNTGVTGQALRTSDGAQTISASVNLVSAFAIQLTSTVGGIIANNYGAAWTAEAEL